MPEFDCSRRIVLRARPERAWEAVATTEGNAGWLFPNEIAADGAGAQAWDPPHRFAIRHTRGDWYNALEFAIEDAEDGTSTLRYVHRGVFPPEDVEARNDEIQQHTDFYLHTLGEYLEHFDGRPATYIGDVPGGIQGPAASATPDGFARLQRALGLEAQAAEGESVRLTPAGIAPIEGVVDYLRPNFLGVRTDDALYCFFGRNAFGGPVAITIHLFAAGADAEELKRTWQRFLDTTLA
jgi:hypothetical protein